MNEWVTHNEPSKDFLLTTAVIWFGLAIALPIVTYAAVTIDKNVELRELKAERSRLQLIVHNREAIIGTMEETIKQLRKR